MKFITYPDSGMRINSGYFRFGSPFTIGGTLEFESDSGIDPQCIFILHLNAFRERLNPVTP